MEAPPCAIDETERLSKLRALAILDTPAEERFDRVTRVAKRIFNVPIAVVSLIDENRQWFKSCFGLDVSETPRSISFCGHAILGHGPLVIEDALLDQRFADNPLVTGEPHIRFYAGQPLSGAGGQALGTLCIIDNQPRQFSEEDCQLLADLAQMIEHEIRTEQLSVIDDLTRISNRRGFISLAKYVLDLCHRQHIPATLAFLDLDKLKEINDTYGHAEGDRALKIVADQMCQSFRASDLFARLGGDEFVVLMTGADEPRVAESLARFQLALDQRCAQLKLPYALQFSYGQTRYDPLLHQSIEDALHIADTAMYQDKVSRRSS